MNLSELESLRAGLIESTPATGSNNIRLFQYYNYFDKILSIKNYNLEEVFLKEFIDDYSVCINKFDIYCVHPAITIKVIEQLKKIITLCSISDNISSLSLALNRLESEQLKLSQILRGEEKTEIIKKGKAFFPLIVRDAPEGLYGIIDSVTVRINKSSEADKFIIIPSEREIEKNILEQCTQSWQIALSLSKNYIRHPYRHHEIIISFDKKEGIYEGNSLGISLTLSFLEQILNYYNPVYTISIKEETAFTGGVNNKGELILIGEEIIKQKTRAVFFSDISSFVFPKQEEIFVHSELKNLLNEYPERKLKTVAVEDIYDVLDRRNLVVIKKQNPALRTMKFLKKNWSIASIVILLTMISAYIFAFDSDTNPFQLSFENQTLLVRNKNGKILWTKVVETSASDIAMERLGKIVDINDDKQNEVLICCETDKTTMHWDKKIRCYDSEGNEKWSYKFDDAVNTAKGIISGDYGMSVIDTITFSGDKSLFMNATSENSFTSAIYRISLLTGKRLPGILWTSGHINIGILDRDQKTITALGIDNGYDDLVLFEYSIDSIAEYRRSIDEYAITGFSIAEMKNYLRFPKTDFDSIFFKEQPQIYIDGFRKDKNLYKIALAHPGCSQYKTILSYEVNDNFKDIDIIFSNDYIVERNTYVRNGRLNPPLTESEEYKNILLDNILFWKDHKWVNRKVSLSHN